MLKILLQKMPMISCQKAAELMSKRLDRGLTVQETFLLWVHTGVCGACHTVARQFDEMRQAFRVYYEELIKGIVPDRELPEAARKRIIDKLSRFN